MNDQKQGYLQYLPHALWEDPDEADFLRRFLSIFEEMFHEIEEKVSDIPKLFDPRTTPAKFLAWLAGWVDLQLDAEWSEKQKRRVLHEIGALYKERGTLEGLNKYLRLYAGDYVKVLEPVKAQAPHRFIVRVNFKSKDFFDYPELRKRVRLVSAIVNQEKPAHTYAAYDLVHPTIQIRKDEANPGHSQIGVDTIIGTTKD